MVLYDALWWLQKQRSELVNIKAKYAVRIDTATKLMDRVYEQLYEIDQKIEAERKKQEAVDELP